MRALLLALAVVSISCVGSTGGALVTFTATASGPSGHVGGTPLVFENGRGWSISLERGVVHLGALYLNQLGRLSGAQATACISTGTYVAEVRAGVDVDVLSPTAVVFPVYGHGTSTAASSGEVWLADGEIDDPNSARTVLDVAGVATRDRLRLRFEGKLTIGKNRLRPSGDPTLPSKNPICKERIVHPIPVEALTPRDGGELHLEIDPAGWFANVDFAEAEPDPADPNHVIFDDQGANAASTNLYTGLRSADSSLYRFTWR